MHQQEVKHHPIMFTLNDAIAGDGFLAGITVYGRALMVKEDDGKWWMYGVNPGAIADTGTTAQEAFIAFRNRYKEVLFDIAQEHKSYNEFATAVKGFFSVTDEEELVRWDEALALVREAQKCAPEPFSELPRVKAETRPSRIEVERLDKRTMFAPSDNLADEYLKAA